MSDTLYGQSVGIKYKDLRGRAKTQCDMWIAHTGHKVEPDTELFFYIGNLSGMWMKDGSDVETEEDKFIRRGAMMLPKCVGDGGYE